MKIYQSTISNRSSNEEIKFNCDALSLYKLTFSLNAIGLNTTMTLYDFYGSINSQIVIDKPSKIEIQFFSLSKLTFSDTLQYDFFITEQKLQCANEQEYADLFLHQKFAIVPLNETGLAKDASLSNVKKLQFDTNNNLLSNVNNTVATDIGSSNTYAKDSSVQTVATNTDNITKLGFNASGDLNSSVNNTVATDIGSSNTYAKDSSVQSVISNTDNIKNLQFDSSNNLKSNVINEITTDIGTTNTYAKDSSVQSVVNNTTNIGKMSFDSSGNQYININASMRLPTDTGLYTQTLQENQTSGTNSLTYNPWGYSTGTIPTVRSGGLQYLMCNVQQNGAKGYLLFNILVQNGTSSSGSANLTLYLYNHLPTEPTNNAVEEITFNSGTIPANTAQWITFYPNINWKYNSLVVVCYAQSISYGSIGIALPNAFNSINSHVWTGTNWNISDDGFVGYWTIIQTAPASLPVSVQSGDITIHSYSAPAKLYQYNANSSYEYTFSPVPVGKRWKILSMSLQGQGANGNSTSLIVYIYPTSTNQNIASYIFAQSSVLDSNTDSPAYVQLSLIADGTGSYLIPSSSSNYETMIFTSLYLYPNQTIKMQTSNTTAYTLGYIEIEYIEENAF